MADNKTLFIVGDPKSAQVQAISSHFVKPESKVDVRITRYVQGELLDGFVGNILTEMEFQKPSANAVVICDAEFRTDEKRPDIHPAVQIADAAKKTGLPVLILGHQQQRNTAKKKLSSSGDIGDAHKAAIAASGATFLYDGDFAAETWKAQLDAMLAGPGQGRAR